MSTRRKKRDDARSFLEKITGGPLNFSRLIEAIRLGEEMSQVEFARTLGVSRAHLCDIEKGRRFVSPEKGAGFARILGYSEERFIKLVLQDQLRRAGLDYKIEIEAA